MKKYKITDIIEDEFGCEGRPEGEEPMVTILLVDDTGKQRSIRMAAMAPRKAAPPESR